MLDRPIIIGPLVGVILGDPVTGLMVGGSLELVWMGLVGIGTSTPPDVVVGSALATALAIKTGATYETTLALAIPISLLAQVGAIGVCILNDGFFFCPLPGQICPTARARLCIGQCAALALFRADTALIGGVDAGSSFLLAALSGLGFCQFPPLMPHKSCRLFRRRTCKVCRFRLSGVGVIFPRDGTGLLLRFSPRRF